MYLIKLPNGKTLNTELLECVKINLENLVKSNPLIKMHPMYKIIKVQLEEGLDYTGDQHKLTKLTTKEEI